MEIKEKETAEKYIKLSILSISPKEYVKLSLYRFNVDT